MKAIRPSELRNVLPRFIKRRRPALLWGPPGVGKSDIIRAVGEELGRKVIDIRLSQMDPTDLRGIPFRDETGMRWSAPAILPRNIAGEENAIVFLDEINTAPQSVQAAAYQLILDRRLGEYVLPDNVSIIAAGNRDTDKGATHKMPTPLLNRFIHLEIDVSFDDWQEWAVLHDIHPDVIGFLTSNKDHLFKFDTKSSEKAFPTPRSWTFVSEMLDTSLSDRLQSAIVGGAVGEGVATEFMAHRRVAARMPKPEDVLAGKVTKLDVNEMSARYSLVIGMCYCLKDYNEKANDPESAMTNDFFVNAFDNFLKFNMANMQPEMNILAARVALKHYSLPVKLFSKLDSFQDFYKKYHKMITQAE